MVTFVVTRSQNFKGARNSLLSERHDALFVVTELFLKCDLTCNRE